MVRIHFLQLKTYKECSYFYWEFLIYYTFGKFLISGEPNMWYKGQSYKLEIAGSTPATTTLLF